MSEEKGCISTHVAIYCTISEKMFEMRFKQAIKRLLQKKEWDEEWRVLRKMQRLL